MGDTGELWRAVREERRTAKRRRYRCHKDRINRMVRRGTLGFRWVTPWCVRLWPARIGLPHEVDFWPSTGTVRIVGRRETGKGWAVLMRALGVHDPFGKECS